MTIAIPISQERISPLLDAAARLLLVTRRRGKEVARNEFVLSPQSPEELARSVAELRVDVLLCAALSEPLRRALERRGVRIQPHLCGEVASVLRAFDCGQLQRDEFRMPGCWGWHAKKGSQQVRTMICKNGSRKLAGAPANQSGRAHQPTVRPEPETDGANTTKP